MRAPQGGRKRPALLCRLRMDVSRWRATAARCFDRSSSHPAVVLAVLSVGHCPRVAPSCRSSSAVTSYPGQAVRAGRVGRREAVGLADARQSWGGEMPRTGPVGRAVTLPAERSPSVTASAQLDRHHRIDGRAKGRWRRPRGLRDLRAAPAGDAQGVATSPRIREVSRPPRAVCPGPCVPQVPVQRSTGRIASGVPRSARVTSTATALGRSCGSTSPGNRSA